MSEFVLEVGAILAGKYRIDAILGRGGMGVVAAAYHLQLEQRVAIKLMLPHALSNPEAVARFLREARAAARISSEHVARVFDVDSLPSGEPYIAMEYLQGSDIAGLLAKQGRFAPEEVIEYVLQAGEALAEAHVAGIVHRDLKPANLFLITRVNGQRTIKILDFGISKVMTNASGTGPDSLMTQTSTLMGSPLYMSPEQMAASKAVDARSDIWSLGVVLYEMLCGAPPFRGETLPQVCLQVMTLPHPALADRVPGLPPQLLAVVERCLQKEPEARFQSVAELAQALSPLASPRARQSVDCITRVLGLQATQRSVPPESAAGVSAGSAHAASDAPNAPELRPGTHATWANTRQPPARRKSRAGIWMAAVVGISSLSGVGVWLRQRLPPVAAVPATPSPAAREPIPGQHEFASLPPVVPVLQSASATPIMPIASATPAASVAAGNLVSARARQVLPGLPGTPADRVATGKIAHGAASTLPKVPSASTPAPAPPPATVSTPPVSDVSKPPTPPIRSRL